MQYPSSELVIDPVLLRKYDVSGPRYTSYPTADRFVEAYGEAELRQWLAKRNIGGISQPLSVYVHLPFCDTLCYYCGCNKVITRDHGRSAKYIKYLQAELDRLAPLLENDRRIVQLHWGGGTPTFLSREEMAELWQGLGSRLALSPECESSLEVDPRRVAPGTMEFLGRLGFNRLSVGVQDFDPDVQKAVHRIQSEEVTRRVIDEARAHGFRSVNVDLIYGLPKQTLDSFNRTLDRTLSLAPDRIALYSYAHLPHVFKPQRRILSADLPSPEVKLQIMTLAIGRLTREGYLYIGMDHFAKPDDELAVAQNQGRLQRNFQGYSTHADCDLIGLGISSIGRVGPTYYQNTKRVDDYYAALDAGRLPVVRGIQLTPDDLVRRAVIQALICQFCLSIESIELSYLVDFKRYFAEELKSLKALEGDGLVELDPEWIRVTPKGRLLVRSICMVFDRYLRETRERASYSKVI
ncbi:MAG TPA: oxygen-independent coproporphyrinogen III oxidase [Burkholderiales bacterium]|nr:oxygen-independent coproporphyrinogen III oxidase [Burkholderiales bacterium]